MFLLDGAVVTSASDLTNASKCEFAFVRQLDVKLGKADPIAIEEDPMLMRAGKLGGEHEDRWLDRYTAQHGKGVVKIEKAPMKAELLRAAAAETVAAFNAQAPVIFQATFFDDTDPHALFVGFADFIVRQPDGRYRVQDTKLARSVKVPALLQLAAYHEQLTRLGIPVDDTVDVILGNDEVSSHDARDILPVYRNRRRRILEIVAARLADTRAVSWGDDRYAIDGRCDWCSAEVVVARDLLLVAGIRVAQRAKLLQSGITSIDEYAATPHPPEGCALPARTYAALHAQAKLQTSAPISDDPHAAPPFDMYNADEVGHLPAADAGDIFFDFEGDPLYRDSHATTDAWGLDYLFGWVDNDETFSALWAHDRAAEKQALLDFLDYVVARRTQFPGMHVYHYASYERTHLLSMSARYGVGEHIVDELLRDGVLVDLYPVVKKSVRVGGRSYSIKKLEPLYMGEEYRSDDGVTNAADSVEEYDKSRRMLAAGDHIEAHQILDSIADYNRYDCVSTLRLRDWLVARASEQGVLPGLSRVEELDSVPFEPSPLSDELLARAAASPEPRERAAFELASAAIDYHRRENKSFWWDHHARLENLLSEWANTRDVFAIDRVEIVSDWSLSGKQTKPRRTLRAHGTWAPGSSAPKGDAFAVYGHPVPYFKPHRRAGSLLDVNVTVSVDEDHDEDHDDVNVVIIEESCPTGESPWPDFPVALTPGPPPRADAIAAAIAEWGATAASGAWPLDAAGDILRGVAPRTQSGRLEPRVDVADSVRAVVVSILDLDDSYVAVQGPPGTGKTYLAAHVIRDLVTKHHWKIGVVAQSHKVVEHVLRGVVKAGLPADLVGKVRPSGAGANHYADEPFTELPADGQLAFAGRRADTGYVIGGTAWDVCNLKRFARGQLDLLVIDEAGQFALANTIAVSVCARNLLLLGDPQQLPQVSQGTHPAPVDQSALGYIAGEHAVLPTELGYFLAESWRMHPDVTRPVSRLSYDDALVANECTSARLLSGISPGIHAVAVSHQGNSTLSLEEADAVASLVSTLLGRAWTNPDAKRAASALEQGDIIVVTPYNAQVETIRASLDAAGCAGVRVGTVDKFQGQEAVVSIVSLAASSAEDVPRGLSFLLSRNRLNVAISRAQWAAYLLYSPTLIEHLPVSAEGVAELSRFISLVDAG